MIIILTMKSDHTILTLNRSWHHTDLEQETLTTSYWPWTGEVDHIILTLSRRSWSYHTDLKQGMLIISYWPWTGDADHIILTLNRRHWLYHTVSEQKLITSYGPWTGEADHIILTLNWRRWSYYTDPEQGGWPHHTDLDQKSLTSPYWAWRKNSFTASYWPSTETMYCIMLTLNRNNVLHHADLEQIRALRNRTDLE